MDEGCAPEAISWAADSARRVLAPAFISFCRGNKVFKRHFNEAFKSVQMHGGQHLTHSFTAEL